MPSKLPLTHEIVIQAEDGKGGTERVPCTAPVLLWTPIGQRRFVMIDDGVGKNKLVLGRVVDVEAGIRIWAPSEVEYFPFPQYDLATLLRCRIMGRDERAWRARLEVPTSAIGLLGLKIGMVGEPEPPAPVQSETVFALKPEGMLTRPEKIVEEREQSLGGLFE